MTADSQPDLSQVLEVVPRPFSKAEPSVAVNYDIKLFKEKGPFHRKVNTATLPTANTNTTDPLQTEKSKNDIFGLIKLRFGDPISAVHQQSLDSIEFPSGTTKIRMRPERLEGVEDILSQLFETCPGKLSYHIISIQYY